MAEKYLSPSLRQKSIYPFHYARKVFIPFIMPEKYLSLSVWQVSVIRNMNYGTVSYLFFSLSANLSLKVHKPCKAKFLS